ncbi:hypothetical protein XA68_16569 [Ophiocordyceps unilateralis]|uniref:Uncharacterized protein n=1 Tax=Ophiocordyceps unilateralis TaxID=268505 RepID=A0A2A9PLJ1_OPHUN|nr:hypothetical protein XA68_16569 [Ophiocordyceps unilateralis]
MSKTTASSWQHQPIQNPTSAAWQVEIPPADVSKLLDGLRPQMMEDKWFIYADEPDGQGRTAVHFCRSWTGDEIFLLNLVAAVDASRALVADQPARLTDIVWEAGRMRETEAKQTARELCTNLLGCRFAVDS